MSDIGYSYLRFSDPKQGKGDSIRRQKQATEDWCKRNNVVLDTSVKLEDKGRSAFKRDDFDKYALAEFLRMIERGRVKKGSYLIIENLDRLSREHVRSGATLCFRILDAGVSIVTTSPEKVYRHDSEDLIDIVMMVMELSRGHSESVIKSERVKQAWGKRKLDIASKPLKELLPLWLDVRGGRVVKRPDRVAVVKRIFRLTLEGSGFGAIMRKLNAEGVPVFKPRVRGSIKSLWQKSSLAVLIRNKAVLGKLEVDGEEKDLLPRIISDDDFYAAQVAVAKRRGSGGRERSMARNLFTSLVVDGDDASRWSLANGGTNSEKRKYIENVAGQQGGAARKALPYDLFEAIILRHLREVTADDLMPGVRQGEDRLTALEGKIEEVDSKLKAIQREVDAHPDIDSLLSLLVAQELKKKALTEEYEDLKRVLATPVADSLTQTHNLIELVEKSEDKKEVRNRLRARIANVVESIRIWFAPPKGRTFAARHVRILINFKRTQFAVEMEGEYTPGRYKHPESLEVVVAGGRHVALGERWDENLIEVDAV